MDVLLRKRQKTVIDSLTDETLTLWKLAKENCQWLVGDPIKVEGNKVDFAMFDFLMSIAKFTPDDMSSDLKMMQRFWMTMFPYLDNVINNLSHYKEKFKELYGIEDVTLRKFADQNLELQCYQKFMKERLSALTGEELATSIHTAFDDYHKAFRDESDAKIAEMREKEQERLKKDQDKAAEEEEAAKKRAFAASLR